ncbi:hypothetical protein [Micromonospora arida]
MAAIEAATGRPSVIWCGPAVGAKLRKERYATGGEYVRGGPAGTDNGGAWSAPILVSATVPDKTLIVADASRLHVLLRKQIQMVESSEYLFAEDKIAFKTTFRIAGCAVAEATSVQIVEEA